MSRILTEQHGRVGLLRLNRPDKLNALNPAMLGEVLAQMRAWDADPGIGCIVVTGNDKAFAAGADIATMAQMTRAEMEASDFFTAWDAIAGIQKPWIAAVNGYALGGGCELALMADILVAAESARFGLPEVTLGVIPGAGGTQRLTRAIGASRAAALILTGGRFTAQQALEWGLAGQVHSDAEYLDQALALAGKIAAMPGEAARAAVACIRAAREQPLSAGLRQERQAFYALFDTADRREGMAAFLEKRTAQFRHK